VQHSTRPVPRFCRPRFLVLAALFAMLAVLFPVSHDVAQAKCNGIGNPVTQNLTSGGITKAKDIPNSSTCDNDNGYWATIQDSYTDGRCVEIRFYKGYTLDAAQYTCSSSAYGYLDSNNNNNFRLCLHTPFSCTALIWSAGY
jgi:hypothetical protein